MYIHHIALWTTQLEEIRNFYIHYFNGISNEKYVNALKGFESYLISFKPEETQIEIMRRKDIRKSQSAVPHVGLAHFSFSTGSKEAVLKLTEELRKDGFTIASEPRNTGDGFFESAILDPDGNLIEITI